MRDMDSVCAMLKENCSMTCTAIVAEVGMSIAIMFCISTGQLEKRKVCAKWIPLKLNEDQHATNVLLASSSLCGILKVVESRMCPHHAGLKHPSAEWHSLMLPQKAPRRGHGALKVMLAMFFSCERLV
jgi:hypothetical protein